MKNPVTATWEWMEERLHLSTIVKATLTEYWVPPNLNLWHTLGSVLIVCFLIQIVTGMLLLVYYVPEVGRAFQSVTFISSTVPFGWLVRRIHAMASHLFVLALLLHLVSTLYMRAYRKPREPQWLTGMVLLGLVMAAGLSGYLLPWSQLSYWATTVATSSPGAVPYVGDTLVTWLRGTPKVTQETLGRFFAMHVSIIPFAIFSVIALHVLFLHQTGIKSPDSKKKTKPARVPFYPNMITKDLFSFFMFLALLNVLIFYFPQLNFPEDALKPANPLETPTHIKPHWYFLANYQALKLVPNELIGLLVQVGAGLVLFFLPFLDRSDVNNRRSHRIFASVVTLGIVAYVGLLVWGHIS